MNIIFWKTNWDFGADARGIAKISNLNHGIEPQRRKSLKKIGLSGFHDFSKFSDGLSHLLNFQLDQQLESDCGGPNGF
jgi:hypothetical protein